MVFIEIIISSAGADNGHNMLINISSIKSVYDDSTHRTIQFNDGTSMDVQDTYADLKVKIPKIS